MNLALITKILHTYLLFYIWSWYICEIKILVKYIYCHKFEMEIIAGNQHNLGKLGRVKVHSHGGQEGDCKQALFIVKAPIIRIVYRIEEQETASFWFYCYILKNIICWLWWTNIISWANTNNTVINGFMFKSQYVSHGTACWMVCSIMVHIYLPGEILHYMLETTTKTYHQRHNFPIFGCFWNIGITIVFRPGKILISLF